MADNFIKDFTFQKLKSSLSGAIETNDLKRKKIFISCGLSHIKNLHQKSQLSEGNKYFFTIKNNIDYFVAIFE